MNIKALLGEAYKEGMTADEQLKLLSELKVEIKDPLEKTVAKQQFDQVSHELAELKRQNKALTAASKTDAEKMADAIAEAEQTTAKYNKLVRTYKGKTKLAEYGITDNAFTDDFFNKAEFANDEEMESVVAKLGDMLKAKIADAERQAKEQVLQSTPKPPAGEEPVKSKSAKAYTLTELMKLKLTNNEEYNNIISNRSD